MYDPIVIENIDNLLNAPPEIKLIIVVKPLDAPNSPNCS